MSEVKKSATALAEEEMLKLWIKEKTFEKSIELRKAAPYFSFYDGPPFASGEPHYGHLEQTTVKDAVARYKTMQGFRVPRRTGWDTHGLPIEYLIEKELGLNSKRDILDYGIEKFNAACRAVVFRHKKDFDRMYGRMARWNNPQETYATLNTDYIESVWWALSQINQKDLLYRGFKSMPYCPRCETPLSNFELNDGYKDDVSDPSVFALFPLKKDPTVSLLAWTTTPWTLPANAALAVDSAAQYVYVQLKDDGSTLILAKQRLDVLDLRNSQYKLLKTVKGSQLVGLRYEPLYPLKTAKFDQGSAKNAHQVFTDSSVSLEDGTGILHVAPRYGEADLALGLKENLPLIESVDSSGHMISGLKGVAGQFFKKADEHIIADLTKQGRIFAAESGFKHTYPFCWRCDTPLMYFATTTWFVAVSQVRNKLLKTAEQINWTPAHVKPNRFGKWLEGARDWAISRNRYWGTPLPIWVNTEDESDYIVVGSIKGLKDLAGPNIKVNDLHRPFIDNIEFKKDGKIYKRVEEVLDCWFESGSMPYAQDHYPFEKEKFDNTFPADFIVEAVEQVHLWFYTLHVLSSILFDKPAYKNVVADGLILAADGRKLSKRLRNYPPIEQLLDEYGADVIRFFVLSSPLMNGEDTRMSNDIFRDILRNVFMTLQNSFSFFSTYAKLDKWQAQSLNEPMPDNLLDKWILARLNQTITEVVKAADSYLLNKATRPIVELLEDLSNWYIRRSRRRFWKGENDGDKEQAYATLHYTLVTICQLMAPWAPFISDKLWRELTDGMRVPESVHLSDWPRVGRSAGEGSSVNKPDKASLKLLDDMKAVRELVVNEGLSQRAEKGIKVRQPLAAAKVNLRIDNEAEMGQIIAEELNVKEVEWVKTGKKVVVDTKLTPQLQSEGIMRELVRNVQNARKNAGLNVEDRIKLRIDSESKAVEVALTSFKDVIFSETLVSGNLDGGGDYAETVKVEGSEVKISLSKA